MAAHETNLTLFCKPIYIHYLQFNVTLIKILYEIKKVYSCSKYIYPGTIDSVILSEVVSVYPLILKYHLDSEVSFAASIDVP
jgi:hypothetical protein